MDVEAIGRASCSWNIRPYVAADEKAVLDILKEPGGHYYNKDFADFSDFQEVYVCEGSEGILGFLCIEIHERISQIICYVAPSQRRKGIGGMLLEYGRERLSEMDPNTVWVFFRNDIGDSASFYRNRGAMPWYNYHYMIHDKQNETKGRTATEVFDKVLAYTPHYFEEYLNGRSRAFLEINKLIDSRPYDERERREEIQKWAERNQKDIWLFFRDEKLIGSIALYEGFFDEVFVIPELQGKGVGAAIVLWALDYCFSKGWSPSLCVVAGNQPAISLYKKTGFTIVQTLELNRFFSSKKEPDLRGPIGG